MRGQTRSLCAIKLNEAIKAGRSLTIFTQNAIQSESSKVLQMSSIKKQENLSFIYLIGYSRNRKNLSRVLKATYEHYRFLEGFRVKYVRNNLFSNKIIKKGHRIA